MSEPSLLLETIIRGIAAGLYLATAIVIARSLRTPSRISGSLSYVSKMAHVIAQFPPAVGPLGLWYLVVDLPSVIGASLTWIFVTEFFQESRKFDWRKIIPLAVVLINAIVAKLSPPDIARPLWLFHNFITVGLMFHVLVIVVRSWSSDLVERRRLIVTPLYIFASLYSIGVAFVQTMELFTFAPRQPSLFAAFTLLGSSLLGIIVFGQAGPELFGQAKTAQPNSQTRNEPVAPLTPAEKSLAAQLDRLMRVERLYRTPNLSSCGCPNTGCGICSIRGSGIATSTPSSGSGGSMRRETPWPIPSRRQCRSRRSPSTAASSRSPLSTGPSSARRA
jgi:hypothetical protein